MASKEGILADEQREVLKMAKLTVGNSAPVASKILSSSPKRSSTLLGDNHGKCGRGGKASAVGQVRWAHSGKSIKVAKDGAGGKGTWGRLLETDCETHLDRINPNYDSDKMDGDPAFKNWGYYEPPPPLKHLNLQLMSTMSERKSLIGGLCDSPLLGSSNGYHSRDYNISSSHYRVDSTRDTWIHGDNTNNNSNRYHNIMPTNHSYGFPMETAPTTSHHLPLQMLQQPEFSSTEEWMVQAEPATGEIYNGPQKKRSAGKSDKGPKMKKPKKSPSGPREGGSGSVQQGAKAAKKTAEVVINGIDMDISSIPIPVCSCTGTPQQCYRWGFGGWQSACCTTGMSMYPLPMSAKRRGARIAGRKMSLGAFKKVLEKLSAEGYNFSNPIDLRSHWAKHGTNKFVTIK